MALGPTTGVETGLRYIWTICTTVPEFKNTIRRYPHPSSYPINQQAIPDDLIFSSSDGFGFRDIESEPHRGHIWVAEVSATTPHKSIIVEPTQIIFEKKQVFSFQSWFATYHRSVTVTNNSTCGPVVITGIVSSHPSVFSVSDTNWEPLQLGEAQSFRVTFSPPPGDKVTPLSSCDITITYIGDDEEAETVSIAVSYTTASLSKVAPLIVFGVLLIVAGAVGTLIRRRKKT